MLIEFNAIRKPSAKVAERDLKIGRLSPDDTIGFPFTTDESREKRQKITVEPCTLAQSDHLWGLVVTKPVILSKKGINMTWCRYNGLHYIQRSAF